MALYQQDLLHTPEGVWDHYGKDSKQYNTVINAVMSEMSSFGYEEIKTPTFEFFDVFSREVGTTPSRELYKFFDKEGNTLVLRPDFTPSVARCAAKYFMDETKPLRFCYAGSAYTNNSNLQGKLKEKIQMGAEFINDDSAYADAEMLALLARVLLANGLENFQITVGNVEYFKGICEAAGLDEETEDAIRENISGKNYYAAESLLEGLDIDKVYIDQFLRITDIAKDDKDLQAILVTAPNQKAAAALRRLMEVYRILCAYGLEKYISFDLSLLSQYKYYTGIIFKGYTYGVGEALASGGRYDTLLSHFGKNAPATGFMIAVDTLIEALRAQNIEIPCCEEPEVIDYTEDTFAKALKKAQELRKSGKRAVLNLKKCSQG